MHHAIFPVSGRSRGRHIISRWMASIRTHIEIPRRLRAFVRSRETSLVALAAGLGLASGLVVTLMGVLVELLHSAFFDLPFGTRLSASLSIDPVAAIAVPTLGGVVFGLGIKALRRWRPAAEIDPIEANALHGGRMSLIGSMIVAAQTVWSSGIGASVGLEAGYTQLASGIASTVGGAFRLRRADMRILVGCGAAGGIAGAFGAPLAGAFYAFEIVIGSYTATSLAPVGIAALLGYLVPQLFSSTHLGIVVPAVRNVGTPDLALAATLGLLAAGLGVGLMRGVALCEALYVRARIPAAVRPALGGLGVGALALVSPQVMSSGHGALHLAGVLDRPFAAIALIFGLKICASIVSLGSNFRGGLFFASLLIGALGGNLFAALIGSWYPAYYPDPNLCAVIGMSALAVSVIGGPLTMTFIALETSSDLWLTTAVLVAVIIASQITRETFGYSFATWRFHLRGETIRSAADIGWIRDLTVGVMMRPDVAKTSPDTTLAAFRHAYPLASTPQVAVVEADGRYAGLVIVAEAHAVGLPETKPIRELLHQRDEVLVPSMTVREAVAMFDRTEAEALVVVEDYIGRRVVGLLTEAYALRRYSAALELRRRELIGQD